MGAVERRHHHLVDITITMLHHANLPHYFWDYAVMTTTHLYNCNPSVTLGGKSPFEVLFGHSLEYGRLHIFGSKCFPCLCLHCKSKLDRKSTPCILLGYPANHELYLCLDPVSGKMYTS